MTLGWIILIIITIYILLVIIGIFFSDDFDLIDALCLDWLFELLLIIAENWPD